MNAQEFLKELIEYETTQYDKFREYQDIAFKTLVEVDRVCRKNNIRYYTAWGTLLGAIRDGGILPWDYDIDLFVPYNVKKDLISALKKDLSSDYYFVCADSDPKCRHYIMRVCPRGYDSSVMHVDVFFLTGASDDINIYQKRALKLRKICNIRYFKLVNAKDESIGSKIRYYYLMFQKLKYTFIPISYLNRKYRKICEAEPQNSTYLMTADSFGANRRYQREWYKESLEIEINGKVFFAPKMHDEVLTADYRDYKNYLSIDSRANEYKSHLKRLLYFDILVSKRGNK